MMLRSLVDEVVRRRMWPIPLVALLIAVAAPLLFMKSSPTSSPASAVPPVATPGQLPAPAKKLVSTSDKAVTPHERSKLKGQDPFAPPASAASAKTASTAAAGTPAPLAAAPAPGSTVTIHNSDGSTATISAPKAGSTSTSKTSSAKKATTKRKATTRKKATTKRKPAPKKPAPQATLPDTTSSSASTGASTDYVDVRFGKRMNSMIRYRVPRLQSFRAGGRVAAMFVHYSATRDVAVFAIAPSTQVGGDVGCRKVKRVCRFVDIPTGEYARLTLRGDNGAYTSRRLDVVSIRRLSGVAKQSPRENTLSAANCLLKNLLKLAVTVPSISADACE